MLATTLEAKDTFRDNPWNLGIIGSFSHSAARQLIDQAGCVVVFGASFNQRTASGGEALPHAAPLIHVDTVRHKLAGFDMTSEFRPEHTNRTVDPRALAVEFDRLLPADRNLVYDSGNYLRVVPYLGTRGHPVDRRRAERLRPRRGAARPRTRTHADCPGDLSRRR